MQTRLELLILKNLFTSDEFTRKVVPYVDADFFSEREERLVFKNVREYFEKYNECPTHEALTIQMNESSGLNQDELSSALNIVSQCKLSREETPQEFLLDETEKWCKDRAVYNAVMDSITILDKDSKRSKGEIPELLRDALSVSFDQHIGHDWLEDAEQRFEFYHTEEDKIPFDLDIFNKISKGGLSNKTLNICMAGTGVGKSLFMCHCAANNLMMGKNCLLYTSPSPRD